MAIIKCKMCGGDINLAEDKTFGTCEYCGCTMTFPKVSDDQRAAAFNRGNYFRRIGEFDKALSIYEHIVADDNTDAEAHWCCALCRYGIEYVEDPVTYEWLPTCHRASFDSFLEDVDYLSAIEYSDGITRRQYQKDAAKIAEVQKGILATSLSTKPYDVFICYKELDENGLRTRDSVLAQEIYYQLTEKRWRVFFSRISLEDVPGTQYEPFIFAALNSAKVMVVVGTSAENLNAVWVKNEWSRFLAIMRKDRSKLLIPCYRDMDPYDLPEQLSVLMSYDMGKIGFIQDLIRGIDKVLSAEKTSEKEKVKETIVVNSSTNIDPLLKRAFLFLEDGDFKQADEYCERVLDQDPENARAYLGKLMVELKVHQQAGLADCEAPFDHSNNYQKAIRFGDEGLSSVLRGYIDHINERNENARLTDIYYKATSAMRSANTESAFKAAAESFKAIPNFKDANALAKQCLDRAEACRRDAIYYSAKSQMTGTAVSGYEAAIKTFRTISGWKDADEQINICQRRIEEIKAREAREGAERLEKERQAEQKRIAEEKDALYASARLQMAGSTIGGYEAAINTFRTISGWKDSDEQIYACQRKIEEIKAGEAREEAERLERDRLAKQKRVAAAKRRKRTIAILIACIVVVIVLSKRIIHINKMKEIASNKYEKAVALIDSGNYEEAYDLLDDLDYKDSLSKKKMIEKSDGWISRCPVGGYVIFGSYEQDNNISNGKEDIEWLVLSKKEDRVLVISKYELDSQKYNTSYSSVTWETCTLREWLNGTFFSTAFSDEERTMVLSVTNRTLYLDKDVITTDQVFLLSVFEAKIFFSSDEERKCAPTEYAIAQGAWKDNSRKVDGKATCMWWLRSPGLTSNYAANIGTAGWIQDYGVDVNFDTGAVRPALWIDLS